MKKFSLTRRSFLKSVVAVPSVVSVVSRHVVAGASEPPPSERVNIAAIGTGHRGHANLMTVDLLGANIVALCDVDEQQGAEGFKKWPNARKYTDFRVMLEKEKGIDAVLVSTPNHVHAPMALAAMELGKHVYVEKPLAHTIHEVRKLEEAARRYKVATQMGNQGHSSPGCRIMKEWIRAGAIGKVSEVHCWTTFPSWPQGLETPTDTPPVPATLDWNLWLGPATDRPYHPAYLPGVWRGWWDFGEGALGDMGCHIMDHAFLALDLGTPTRVTAESSGGTKVSGPLSSVIRYEFPKRGKQPPLTLTWYDGGKMPPRPEELEPERKMGGDNGGILFVGDKGKIMATSYGTAQRIIPESKMQAYAKKKVHVAFPKNGHHGEWLDACKTGAQCGSHFGYAGPLTELVFLGILAIRAGTPIEWDPEAMKVKNNPEADEFVTRTYRSGWAI